MAMVMNLIYRFVLDPKEAWSDTYAVRVPKR
jgi:hypothetical protein